MAALELTGTEIATTLIMERQVDRRLAIVVEGDEECALIDIHLLDQSVKTQPSGSKSAVLEAAVELEATGVDWAICVVDADFSRVVQSNSPYAENVLLTSQYDLLTEALIHNPEVLTGVAISHSRPGLIRAFEQTNAITVFDHIVEVTYRVGYLRYLVVSGHYLFSVRRWSFAGATDYISEQERLGRIAEEAQRRSSYAIAANDFALALTGVESQVDKGAVLNGHDIVDAMSSFVSEHGGTPAPGKRQVAASIRIALSCSQFRRLPTIVALDHWASTHLKQIFRCEEAA